MSTARSLAGWQFFQTKICKYCYSVHVSSRITYNNTFEDVLCYNHLVKGFFQCAVEYIQRFSRHIPLLSLKFFSGACTSSDNESLKTKFSLKLSIAVLTLSELSLTNADASCCHTMYAQRWYALTNVDWTGLMSKPRSPSYSKRFWSPARPCATLPVSVPVYHIDGMSLSDYDGGLKKMSRQHWFWVDSTQADPSQSLRWGGNSGVHSHTHTHTNVTVSFNPCNNCDHIATSFFFPEKGKLTIHTTPLWQRIQFSLVYERSQFWLCHSSVSICLCRSCNTVVCLCGFLTRFNRCIYCLSPRR